MSDNNDTTGIERLQQLIGPDYTLKWIIGHGGMSTVWLADDVNNGNREVAIKVLRPEFSDNSEFLSRFRNEALAAEKIDSDNVVQTYDYREITDAADHTFCFIVMEYVPGESLADRLVRDGVVPEEDALDIFEQVAHGLSVIHSLGMVHRDIKPGNILITDSGHVKITDFGIAKAAAAVPLTRTGMVVGTAQYVSPEQAQGQKVSPASDVYSLGVVGYEMLAGRRPFNGDSSVSVAIAHINQAPPQLPQTVTGPARELIGIALRKDPQRRFSDGQELERAVSAVRLGQRPPQPRFAAAATAVHSPPPASPPATKLGEAVNVQRHVPQQTAHSARPPQTRRPQDQGASSKSGRSNGGVIALVVIVLIVVSALLIWMLYNSGILSGGSANETSTSSTPLVTEWVTTTVNPTGGNDEPVSQAPTGGTSLEPVQPSRGAPETQNAAPSEFMSEQNSNSEQRRRRDEDTYPSQYYQEPSSAASVPSVEQPTSEQNGASQ